MITVQLVLKNEFGEFLGKKVSMSEDKYKQLVEIANGFYNKDGFELSCEDGSYMVFAPEIVKKSILIVKKIKEDV